MSTLGDGEARGAYREREARRGRRRARPHDDAAAVGSQVNRPKNLRIASDDGSGHGVFVLRVIDLSPGGSFVGGDEDAAHTANLRVGEQSRISRSRCAFAESDDVSLIYIREFRKAGASVGGRPQAVNVVGSAAASETNIAR